MDSCEEIGIVSAKAPLSTNTTAQVQQYDDSPGSPREELKEQCQSPDGTSCCEERDGPRQEIGLRDVSRYSTDGREKNISVTVVSEEQERKATSEKPKKVSTRRKRWALYYLLRFHVPSLAITIFLMVLYCRHWIWPEPGPSAEILSALQFAAKIHEGLIILSLTNMVLHRLRFLLLYGQGVPLGLLSSPFQLASPSYFITAQFWGAVKSSLTAATGAATVLLVTVSLLLAMAIGPFSAIVMLPSYGLWDVPADYRGLSLYSNGTPGIGTPWWQAMNGIYLMPWYHTTNDTIMEQLSTVVAAVSPQDLYPTHLGPELGITWSCPDRFNYSKGSYGCRNLFNDYFPDIIQQVPSLNHVITSSPDDAPMSDDGMKEMGAANITAIRSGGTVWLANNVLNPVAMATTPLWLTADVTFFEAQFMARQSANDFFLKRPEYLTHAGTPVAMKQPAVMTQCAMNYSFSQHNFTAGVWFPFAAGLFPSFNLTVDDTLAALVRNCSLTRREACMTYVDIQKNVPYPISTAVLIVDADYDGYGNVTDGTGLEICIVSARWVEAQAWGGLGQSSWGVLKQNPVDLVNQTEHVDTADIIRIDADWMMGLDYSPYTGNTMKQTLGDDVKSDYDFFAATCNDPNLASIGISTMLASALSTVQCAFRECNVYSDSDAEYYNFTRVRTIEQALAAGDELRIRTTYLIWAYGYNVRSSWLTAAGIAVLLFHAVLVLAHAALILGGGFWTSDSWGSLGELVALALRSSPPCGLANATARVSRMSTWQLVAVVRERVSEDRLELVLIDKGRRGDPSDFEGEMGTVGERERGELAVPRCDKKYG